MFRFMILLASLPTEAQVPDVAAGVRHHTVNLSELWWILCSDAFRRVSLHWTSEAYFITVMASGSDYVGSVCPACSEILRSGC